MHSKEPKMPKKFWGLRPSTPAAAPSARCRTLHSRPATETWRRFAPLYAKARCKFILAGCKKNKYTAMDGVLP